MARKSRAETLEIERHVIIAKGDYIASLSKRIVKNVPVGSIGGVVILDMLKADMRRLLRQAESCKEARDACKK
jgi:hypothetical protein